MRWDTASRSAPTLGSPCHPDRSLVLALGAVGEGTIGVSVHVLSSSSSDDSINHRDPIGGSSSNRILGHQEESLTIRDMAPKRVTRATSVSSSEIPVPPPETSARPSESSITPTLSDMTPKRVSRVTSVSSPEIPVPPLETSAPPSESSVAPTLSVSAVQLLQMLQAMTAILQRGDRKRKAPLW
ncbi:uncharacterized protein PB18E9.04c-like [Magnolia sinica]|uniref:uncharacterized protein PB18E9.04c-like n=1 Tax=Magnolia sinica TaxID=86752 RepID=UPI002658C209|nr:uncharacterized protein PB18E9.04c-like [Magnolia sinica]